MYATFYNKPTKLVARNLHIIVNCYQRVFEYRNMYMLVFFVFAVVGWSLFEVIRISFKLPLGLLLLI